MANIRMSRINSEIQRAVAEIITNRLQNPNLDGYIISVVDVNTASDLSFAKVYISVLSTDETKSLVLSELIKAKSFIKRELTRLVRLRRTPELEFEIDNTYEKSQKILNLFDKISTDNKGE